MLGNMYSKGAVGWWRNRMLSESLPPCILIDLVKQYEELRGEAVAQLKANIPTSSYGLHRILPISAIRDDVWEMMKKCQEHEVGTLWSAFHNLDATRSKEVWELIQKEYDNMTERGGSVADDEDLKRLADSGTEFSSAAQKVITRLSPLPTPLWKACCLFKLGDNC